MIEAAGFVILASAFAVGRSIISSSINTERFPWGTLLVNVVGSFAAGALVAVAPASWSTLVGVGALGAFTTFSTFAVEVMAMWAQHRGTAVVYSSATTVLAIGAAAVGLGL